MDRRLGHIGADIRAIVSHFERSYILPASMMGGYEGRLDAPLHETHR